MGTEKSEISGDLLGFAKRGLRYKGLFLSCISGVLINVLAGMLGGVLPIPLYLDTVGTVLVAALGGYLPAVIVGLVTNIIKSISDPASIYYAFINVLIAVIVALMCRDGWLRKWYKALCTALVLSLIGGIVGSILTWFLYGFATEGISASLAAAVFDATGMPMFFSQLSADFLLDLLDKFITVFFVYFIQMLVPEKTAQSIKFDGWQ